MDFTYLFWHVSEHRQEANKNALRMTLDGLKANWSKTHKNKEKQKKSQKHVQFTTTQDSETLSTDKQVQDMYEPCATSTLAEDLYQEDSQTNQPAQDICCNESAASSSNQQAAYIYDPCASATLTEDAYQEDSIGDSQVNASIPTLEPSDHKFRCSSFRMISQPKSFMQIFVQEQQMQHKENDLTNLHDKLDINIRTKDQLLLTSEISDNMIPSYIRDIDVYTNAINEIVQIHSDRTVSDDYEHKAANHSVCFRWLVDIFASIIETDSEEFLKLLNSFQSFLRKYLERKENLKSSGDILQFLTQQIKRSFVIKAIN